MCTPDYKTQMKIAPEVGYGQHEIQLVVAAHQLWLPGTSNSAAAWLGTCIISSHKDVRYLPRRISRLQNVISFESACYICYKTSLQQASFSIQSRSDPDTIILTQAALINLEEHFPAAAAPCPYILQQPWTKLLRTGGSSYQVLETLEFTTDRFLNAFSEVFSLKVFVTAI
jgi:hypothetical protein